MEPKGGLICGKGADDFPTSGNLNQTDKSRHFNAEINGKSSGRAEWCTCPGALLLTDDWFAVGFGKLTKSDLHNLPSVHITKRILTKWRTPKMNLAQGDRAGRLNVLLSSHVHCTRSRCHSQPLFCKISLSHWRRDSGMPVCHPKNLGAKTLLQNMTV